MLKYYFDNFVIKDCFTKPTQRRQRILIKGIGLFILDNRISQNRPLVQYIATIKA